jgi:3-methyl-2-oxobutanoate hydroxymethyltransferase
VAALVEAEIPVMAHLGLTPQSIHKLGGFRVQGRGEGPRRELLEAARELEAAGAFSLVLECVPADLACEVTSELEIPTIGIGAGPDCDGQVLVFHDLLGLEDRLSPRFVRRYAELGQEARRALSAFAKDVREGRFPSIEESYDDPTIPSAEPIRKIYG